MSTSPWPPFAAVEEMAVESCPASAQFTFMSWATPSCRPATDMMILKVDPGASCAWIALSSSGWSGSVISLFHSSRWMRTAKSLGSKLGRQTSARISPVCGSIAIIAPLRSPSASSAARWMSMSMVSLRLFPGVAGSCPACPLRARGCRRSRRASRPRRAAAGRSSARRPICPPHRQDRSRRISDR